MSTAVVGGMPSLQTDIPISAVLLTLFACSAAAHMTILQLNKRRHLKFLFSGMLFVLSILRTIALSMRIVWATRPRAADIAIAAGILTQTGSVLVFVINLFLAQRVVRGYHPRFGWHAATNSFFIFLVACVVASLVMAIAVTVQTVLTLDADIRRADRTVQLFAGTYMAVLSFLPIPIVLLAMAWPRKTHIERFGAGRWRTKVRILLFTTAVATLGTAFRIYTNYAPRPVTDPAWYHSRACYYCFNYVVDLVISATFLFSRFDRRFIVPNGAKGPGDYAKGVRDATITTTGAGGAGGASSIEKKGGDDDDDEKDGGHETDSEKLAELSHSNEDVDSEKGHLPVCDDDEDDDDEVDLVDGDEKAPVRDKGKGKEVNVEEDEKHSSNDNDETPTQTYGPGGQWNGVPWPFRASWTTPRVFGPGQREEQEEHEPLPAEPVNHSRVGDGDSTEIGSSTDGSHSRSNSNSTNRGSRSAGGGTSEEASSQWGGETSSTCIQEPEAAHLRNITQQQQQQQQRRSHSHHHHPHHHPLYNHNNHNHNHLRPHSLQHSQSYVFGQALTSNDSIPMSAADGPSSSSTLSLSFSPSSPNDGTSTAATTSVWPFMSERHYNDSVTQAGPSRSNSAAAAYYRYTSSYAGGGSSSNSSSSRAPLFPGSGGSGSGGVDRGRVISRSRSCNIPGDKDRRAEAIAAATAAAEGAGGWI
ncbi:hypothetical protein F5Y07DRAFT_179173 [Xylaria sp. FL0933]|nr:hypothetical protein F5Y07DRAFT_179173 [Xylaria sp. FL0933]